MLETSKGDITFIWDRRERYTLRIWDLPHLNSTSLSPSSSEGKKLQTGHIFTQNFEGDLRNNNKNQRHPLAEQQDPWDYCCLDLLLARNLLHRWAAVASWQGNPSQLISTLFPAPLSAQWVFTHLEPASTAAQDLPCSVGGGFNLESALLSRIKEKTEVESPSKGVVSLTSLASLDFLNPRLPAKPTRTSFHTALLTSHSSSIPRAGQ